MNKSKLATKLCPACGVVKTYRASQKTCGCRRQIDFSGQKINSLSVLYWDKGNQHKQGKWLCQCDCGEQTRVSTNSLRTGRIKSCGCIWKSGDYNAVLRHPDAAFKETYRVYRRSARLKGYDFLLSSEQFQKITGENCFYCGIYPSNEKKLPTGNTYKYNGIDRLDNTIGYILSNCVPCCKPCNYAKQRMTVPEFAGWIARAYHHLWRPVA